MIRKKCYYFMLIIFLIFVLLLNNLISSYIKSSTSLSSIIISNNQDDLGEFSSLESFNNYYKNFVNYLNDSDEHVIWFIQISDLHLSEFHDSTRITDLEHFCNETLRLINPSLVLASGDLTDSKTPDLSGSEQYEFEWKTYKRVIDICLANSKTDWLDIRGNHDNFNVLKRQSPRNFFRKYGVMKTFDGSYMHEISRPNGDKYSFIGVDASLEPGPRRPFNFFGSINKDDLELLNTYSVSSQNHNGTIWFGHFPTAIIHSSSNLRSVMNTGVAYLCGHLHTLGGLMPNMYGRQSNGMLELELADWKVNRIFRLIAFDAGLFSFRDINWINTKTTNTIFTLITNPKNILTKTFNNREPLTRMRYSTHIRILVFSKHSIKSVQVYLNDYLIGNARRAKDTGPLFIIEWNPFNYLVGVHKIKVVVQDITDSTDVVVQEFSLDNTSKAFSFMPSLLLMSDQMIFTKSVFYIQVIITLLILLFFRFNRRRFTVRYVSCGLIRTIILKYLRRFALLSSINFAYWYLILNTIYVAIGPWFIGKIVDDHLGVCFVWGIFVKNVLLKPDTQYLAGVIHMVLFELPLILHLAYQIEICYLNLNFYGDSSPTSKSLSSTTNPHSNQQQTSPSQTSANNTRKLNKLNRILIYSKEILLTRSMRELFMKLKFLSLRILNNIWKNISLYLFVLFCLFQMYDLYLSYSYIAALLCPLKTWNLLIALFIRYKCTNLTVNDFNLFIESIPRLSNQTNTNVINNDLISLKPLNPSNKITMESNDGSLTSGGSGSGVRDQSSDDEENEIDIKLK